VEVKFWKKQKTNKTKKTRKQKKQKREIDQKPRKIFKQRYFYFLKS
jgi:hypothetical protein